MMTKNYLVRYRLGDTNSQTTISLCGCSESEARQKLISRGTVPASRADELIIYSVDEL